jgi:hypothetical protein
MYESFRITRVHQMVLDNVHSILHLLSAFTRFPILMTRLKCFHQPVQALNPGQPASRPGSDSRECEVCLLPVVVDEVSLLRKVAHDLVSRAAALALTVVFKILTATRSMEIAVMVGKLQTSSRKAKSEQLASAEISLDNILEGGRRKSKVRELCKSDSTWVTVFATKFADGLPHSGTPLFVPPQVPMTTSISSVSPQRRTIGQEGPSPFARPSQRTFAYNQPLQSPQSYGHGEQGYGFAPQTALSYTTPSTASHGHRLRDRSSFHQLDHRIVRYRAPMRQESCRLLIQPSQVVSLMKMLPYN